jgi:putative lipoprotein (rSAM/lipoprotein system)
MRKVYTGLGLGAVALVFQACYGPPPPAIEGVVKSEKTGEPIKGIQVSVENTHYEDITDDTGRFWVYEMYDLGRGVYTLKFDDIDGAENGAYVSKTEKVDLTRGYKKLEIELEDDADAE